MNINTMTFVAPNLACGKARGGRIPRSGSVTDEQRQPQAKFGATRRAAVLFRPDFVARSLQIHCGICSSLAPRLAEKSLAANVIVFMFMTTKLHQRIKVNLRTRWVQVFDHSDLGQLLYFKERLLAHRPSRRARRCKTFSAELRKLGLNEAASVLVPRGPSSSHCWLRMG